MKELLELITEAQIDTVSLYDLYDSDELDDESEQLYHWVEPEDLEREHRVRTLDTADMMGVKTATSNETVIDVYRDFASEDQREIVQNKIDHWDNDRIIVMMNNTLIDGNHHLVAGILSNRPVKYIDLASYD